MSGQTLREIREARRLSRPKVARALDISEKTVERLENGTTPLKRVYLLGLASLYEVPVEELENGSEAA